MVFEASAGFKLRLSVETITPPQASPRHLTVLLCPGGGNLASVVVIWVGHLTPYGSEGRHTWDTMKVQRGCSRAKFFFAITHFCLVCPGGSFWGI